MAVLAMILLGQFTPERLGWLVMPTVLALTAWAGARRQNLTAQQVGLGANTAVNVVRPVAWGICLVCAAAFVLVSLLDMIGYAPPLAVRLRGSDWLAWALYQVGYVAVAEEIFFRGYILGSLLNLGHSLTAKYNKYWPATCVLIAAALFAGAHVVIAGQAIAALTFIPAILFGYLRLRTGAVWASIMCHAAANLAYGAACAAMG